MSRKPFTIAYLELAEKIAEDRSSDHFTKVAAVATNDRNEIICVSYNGTLPGYEFPFDETLDENRDKKNLLYFHSEENIIFRCKRGEVHSVYLNVSPCKTCARLLAGHSVKEVYYRTEYHREQDFKFIFDQYGVKYQQIKE